VSQDIKEEPVVVRSAGIEPARVIDLQESQLGLAGEQERTGASKGEIPRSEGRTGRRHGELLEEGQ